MLYVQRKNKIYLKIGRSTNRFVFFYLFILFLHTCYIRVCFQVVPFVRENIWHKALLMGYSIRLEITLVCSLNVFQLVMGLCKGHSLFFLEYVYRSLLYPSLIFDIFLSLCVCVLEWFCISLIVIFLLCVCVSVCVLGIFCVCLCVVVWFEI